MKAPKLNFQFDKRRNGILKYQVLKCRGIVIVFLCEYLKLKNKLREKITFSVNCHKFNNKIINYLTYQNLQTSEYFQIFKNYKIFKVRNLKTRNLGTEFLRFVKFIKLTKFSTPGLNLFFIIFRNF